MACPIFANTLSADLFLDTAPIQDHLPLWAEAAFHRSIEAGCSHSAVLTVLCAAAATMLVDERGRASLCC